MDNIYTGNSDDDGGHGDHELQSFDSEYYKAVDKFTTEDKDVIQRVTDKCINYNWNGNVCYVSDVIVPPGRDGVIRFINDICGYYIF